MTHMRLGILMMMTASVCAAPLPMPEPPPKEVKPEPKPLPPAETKEPVKEPAKEEAKQEKPPQEDKPVEPQAIDIPSGAKDSRFVEAKAIVTPAGVRIVKCFQQNPATDKVTVRVECWTGSGWDWKVFDLGPGELIGKRIPPTRTKPAMDFQTHWRIDSVLEPELRDVKILVKGQVQQVKRTVRVVTLLHEWATEPGSPHEELSGELIADQDALVELDAPPPESERPAGK